MAKRKKKDDLDIAKQYRDLLLYELTGGNMGKQPEKAIKSEVATFGEKRGFLDSMIKIAALERKDTPEEEDSGFDLIKKGMLNGGAKARSRRDPWAGKDIPAESDSASAESGESDDSEGSGSAEEA